MSKYNINNTKKVLNNKNVKVNNVNNNIKLIVTNIIDNNNNNNNNKSVDKNELPNALCFIIDSTASMQSFITALNKILPDIIQMIALTDSFKYISIIAYTDYDNKCIDKVIEFSNWLVPNDMKLLEFASKLKPCGGGGHPEAFKTAAYYLVEHSDHSFFPNLLLHHIHIIHLTDAGAHLIHNNLDCEGRIEMKLLGKQKFDYIYMVNNYFKSKIFTYSCLTTIHFLPYYYLTYITNGNYHYIENTNSLFDDIKNILNGWYGLLLINTTSTVYSMSLIEDNYKTEKDFTLYIKLKPIKKDITILNLSLTVSNIALRMKYDENYIIMAINLLDNITKTSPLVLCSNILFGKIWREFCRRRNDPRRLQLMSQLDIAKTKLTNEELVIFDEWNKSSYNMTDEIIQTINEYVIENGVMDGNYLTFTPDIIQLPCDILEFSRTCNSNDQGLIIQFLTRLSIITYNNYVIQPFTLQQKEEYELNESKRGYSVSLVPLNSIPLNLPLSTLFSIILHLIAPGTLLSQRPSAIVALLASRCQCVISNKANEFLNNIKGKWLTWDKINSIKNEMIPIVNENYSLNFLYLLNSCQESLFLKNELIIIKKLIKYGFIRQLLKMDLEIEMIREGSMDGIFIDYLLPCTKSCNKNRPISLITKDNLCGYCYWDIKDNIPLNKRKIQSEVPANETFMVQCAVCEGFYARDKNAILLGRSQCFVCYSNNYLCNEMNIFNNKKMKKFNNNNNNKLKQKIINDNNNNQNIIKEYSPFVECKICNLKFITYHGLPNNTCAQCKNNPCQRKPIYDSLIITLSKLFSPILSNEVHVKILLDILGIETNTSLDVGIIKAIDTINDIENKIPLNFPLLYYNNKKIINSNKIWNQIIEAINKQSYEYSLCSICCVETPSDKLFLACGRHNCSQRLCFDCGNNWYGELLPGKLLNMRHLKCPFCVKTPTLYTINRWNKLAKKLCGTTDYNPQMFYVWCISCNHAIEYGPRECAGNGTGPRLNDYECEACRYLREQEIEKKRIEEEELAQLQLQREINRLNIIERRNNIRNTRENNNILLLNRSVTTKYEINKVITSQKCPSCHVIVVLAGGCNHITCVCGQHFCYECGEGFKTGNLCYSHMSLIHHRMYMDETPMFDDND